MNKLKVVFVISSIFVILVVIICCFSINYNNKTKITLVDCIDGDTARFVIDGREEKVRFLGINAPESTYIQEEYGKEASNYTCDLLKKADDIYIEYDVNSDKRDKYNRVLGWIFVDNNNLSELLLSSGYAEVKYIYGDYKYINYLCTVQYMAYKDRLGIWNNNYDSYSNNYCYKNNY